MSICALCDNPSYVRYRDHPGYQHPAVYDIYHCLNCNTSHVYPLSVDTRLYDLIYSKARMMPGYDRYHEYAAKVLRTPQPLAYLSNAEDMYWAISQALKKEPHKILEVGSGLGYLTYALSKEGYDVLGVDISQHAVNQAIEKYGNLFLCADIYKLSREATEAYETVILTEVIEHVPHPKSFLEAVAKLTAPGGQILLTTPNKSAHHPDVLWETEPPPIHLWWFSERSMQQLASQLGLRVDFIDFTSFNLSHSPHLVQTPHQPTRAPRLDEEGNLYHKNWKSLFKRQASVALRRMGLMDTAKRFLYRASMRNPETSSRRNTLCAVFTKEGKASL